MRENMRNKLKERLGYTLLELMIVVAITIILAAFGSVAVIDHMYNLKYTEMNNMAREIFVAAQNHLTASKISGEWENAYDTYTSKTTDENKNYLGKQFDRSQDSIYPDRNATNYETKKQELDSAETNRTIGEVRDKKQLHDWRYLTVNPSYEGLNKESSESNALSIMLPYGSLDDTVRLGGTYIVEYDATTATVYGVFYTQGKEEITGDQLSQAVYTKGITQNREDRKLRFRFDFSTVGGKGKESIGYYGGASSVDLKKDVDDQLELAPEVSMQLLNEDRLILLLSVRQGIKKNTDKDLHIKIYGTTGKAKELVSKKYQNFTNANVSNYTNENTGISNRVDGFQIKNVTIQGKPYTYNQFVFILDSIVDSDRHFSKLLSSNNGLVLGDDIYVTAELDKKELSRSNLANSLFGNGSFGINRDDNKGVTTALIKNARHLENLSDEISGVGEDLNGSSVITANIENDIDWSTTFSSLAAEATKYELRHSDINSTKISFANNKKGTANEYYGIYSRTLRTFNGNGKTLSNFNIHDSHSVSGAKHKNLGLSGITANSGQMVGLISWVDMLSNQNEALQIQNFTLENATINGLKNASTGAVLGGFRAANTAPVSLTLSNVTVQNPTYQVKNTDAPSFYALGGLIGYVGSGDIEIDHCKVTSKGALTINGRQIDGAESNDTQLSHVGGFIGNVDSINENDSNGNKISSLIITDSEVSAKNDLTIKGGASVGGFIGEVWRYLEKCKIENSAVKSTEGSVDISAPTMYSAGGIIGDADFDLNTLAADTDPTKPATKGYLYLKNVSVEAKQNISISASQTEEGASAQAGGIIGYLGHFYESSQINGRGGTAAGVSADTYLDNVNVQAEGNVTISSAVRQAGGLIGSIGTESENDAYENRAVRNVSIKDSHVSANAAAITGKINAGGLIGYANISDKLTIQNSSVDGGKTGVVQGEKNIGGFIGEIEGGTVGINNSFASILVEQSGDDKSASLGGFIGELNSKSAAIAECYSAGRTESGIYDSNTGNVKATQAEKLGGFIGAVTVNVADGGTITNSYSTMSVYRKGNDQIEDSNNGIGGFIGTATGGNEIKVSNCYSTGLLTVDNSAKDISGLFVGKTKNLIQKGDKDNYVLSGVNTSISKISADNSEIAVKKSVSDKSTGNPFHLEETQKAAVTRYDITLGTVYDFASTRQLKQLADNQTITKNGNIVEHIGDWPLVNADELNLSIKKGNKLTLNFTMDKNETFATLKIVGKQSEKSAFAVVHKKADGSLEWSGLKPYPYQNPNWEGGLPSGISYGKPLNGFSETVNDVTSYTIWLDDITTNQGSARYIFMYDSALSFILGENLEISAGVGRRNTLDFENTSLCNMLYESIDDNNDGTYTAHIASARHLENLSDHISGIQENVRAIKVTKAIQDADIQWNSGSNESVILKYDPFISEIHQLNKQNSSNIYKGDTSGQLASADQMAAIQSKNLVSYNGNGYKLDNFTITNQYDGNSNGLFGKIENSFTAEKMKISNENVQGGTRSGGLIGEISTNASEITISDVHIYGKHTVTGDQKAGGLIGYSQAKKLQIERVYVYGSESSVTSTAATEEAGGLIGKIEGLTENSYIKDSAASVLVKGGQAVGGLIGELSSGNIEIENTYVGGHTNNGTYTDRNSFPEKVSDHRISNNILATNGCAGGFIGSTVSGTNNVKIENCYTTASVQGNTAGGFIGRLEDGISISNTYATGLVSGAPNSVTSTQALSFNTLGTFAGANRSANAGSNNYYLSGINDFEMPVSGKYSSGNSKNSIASPKTSRELQNEKKNNAADKGNITYKYDTSLTRYPYRTVNADENNANIAHYGDWANVNMVANYRVTFMEVKGGTTRLLQWVTVPFNQSVNGTRRAVEQNLAKSGAKVFAGWYTEATAGRRATADDFAHIRGNITFYARYRKTVKFMYMPDQTKSASDPNSWKEVTTNPVIVNEDGSVNVPTEPDELKKSYRFLGWYEGKTTVSEKYTVKGGVISKDELKINENDENQTVIYGLYQKLNTYTVTVHHIYQSEAGQPLFDGSEVKDSDIYRKQENEDFSATLELKILGDTTKDDERITPVAVYKKTGENTGELIKKWTQFSTSDNQVVLESPDRKNQDFYVLYSGKQIEYHVVHEFKETGLKQGIPYQTVTDVIQVNAEDILKGKDESSTGVADRLFDSTDLPYKNGSTVRIIEKKKAPSGSFTNAKALNLTDVQKNGFSIGQISNDTVAELANGKFTTVTITYTRNQFAVNYDVNGSENELSAEPFFYGQKIDKIPSTQEAKRTGYHLNPEQEWLFTASDQAAQDEAQLPTGGHQIPFMPACNVTAKAQWVADQYAKVTVEYWQQKATAPWQATNTQKVENKDQWYDLEHSEVIENLEVGSIPTAEQLKIKDHLEESEEFVDAGTRYKDLYKHFKYNKILTLYKGNQENSLTKTVKEDGSTVYRVYYDRDIMVIKFDYGKRREYYSENLDYTYNQNDYTYKNKLQQHVYRFKVESGDDWSESEQAYGQWKQSSEFIEIVNAKGENPEKGKDEWRDNHTWFGRLNDLEPITIIDNRPVVILYKYTAEVYNYNTGQQEYLYFYERSSNLSRDQQNEWKKYYQNKRYYVYSIGSEAEYTTQGSGWKKQKVYTEYPHIEYNSEWIYATKENLSLKFPISEGYQVDLQNNKCTVTKHIQEKIEFIPLNVDHLVYGIDMWTKDSDGNDIFGRNKQFTEREGVIYQLKDTLSETDSTKAHYQKSNDLKTMSIEQKYYEDVWIGLYEEPFENPNLGYSYKWPSDKKYGFQYDNETGGSTYLTFMTAFLPQNGEALTLNLYEVEYNGRNYVHHYRQNIDGSWPNEKFSTPVNGSNGFGFTDKYPGFSVMYANTDGSKPTIKTTANAKAGMSWGKAFSNLHVFHVRNKYKVELNNVKFVWDTLDDLHDIEKFLEKLNVYYETPLLSVKEMIQEAVEDGIIVAPNEVIDNEMSRDQWDNDGKSDWSNWAAKNGILEDELRKINIVHGSFSNKDNVEKRYMYRLDRNSKIAVYKSTDSSASPWYPENGTGEIMPNYTYRIAMQWNNPTYTLTFNPNPDSIEELANLQLSVQTPAANTTVDSTNHTIKVSMGTELLEENIFAFDATELANLQAKGYNFQYWYYMDSNNIKRKFVPGTRVRQDYNLSAEWTFSKEVKYTVQCIDDATDKIITILDENSKEKELVEDYTGYVGQEYTVVSPLISGYDLVNKDDYTQKTGVLRDYEDYKDRVIVKFRYRKNESNWNFNVQRQVVYTDLRDSNKSITITVSNRSISTADKSAVVAASSLAGYRLKDGTPAQHTVIKPKAGDSEPTVYFAYVPANALLNINVSSSDMIYNGQENGLLDSQITWQPLADEGIAIDLNSLTDQITGAEYEIKPRLSYYDQHGQHVEGKPRDTGVYGVVVDLYLENKANSNDSICLKSERFDEVLTISPKKVLLESNSYVWSYDGDRHFAPIDTAGNQSINEIGWADGEGAKVEFDQDLFVQKVGDEAVNSFTYELNEGTDAKNYDIITKFGTLKITEADTITISFQALYNRLDRDELWTDFISQENADLAQWHEMSDLVFEKSSSNTVMLPEKNDLPEILQDESRYIFGGWLVSQPVADDQDGEIRYELKPYTSEMFATDMKEGRVQNMLLIADWKERSADSKDNQPSSLVGEADDVQMQASAEEEARLEERLADVTAKISIVPVSAVYDGASHALDEEAISWSLTDGAGDAVDVQSLDIGLAEYEIYSEVDYTDEAGNAVESEEVKHAGSYDAQISLFVREAGSDEDGRLLTKQSFEAAIEITARPIYLASRSFVWKEDGRSHPLASDIAGQLSDEEAMTESVDVVGWSDEFGELSYRFAKERQVEKAGDLAENYFDYVLPQGASEADFDIAVRFGELSVTNAKVKTIAFSTLPYLPDVEDRWQAFAKENAGDWTKWAEAENVEIDLSDVISQNENDGSRHWSVSEAEEEPSAEIAPTIRYVLTDGEYRMEVAFPNAAYYRIEGYDFKGWGRFEAVIDENGREVRDADGKVMQAWHEYTMEDLLAELESDAPETNRVLRAYWEKIEKQ